MKYALVIDQGTTSTRVIIYDERGNAIFNEKKELKQIYPNIGYVEHDPMEIFNDTVELMETALKEVNIEYQDIIGAGITNQRETTVLWNKDTGLPIYNAICWQSTQSEYICEDLKNKGLEKTINDKTGLVINPYFSATKIKWILDNVDGAKTLMDEGKLMFGTIDTWLSYKLTGKHVTDYTNASRTMLFNIHDLKWDDELLKIFDINKNILPEVIDSNKTVGIINIPNIKKYLDLELCALSGDQEASLVGHGAFYEGDIKITYGTGSFMLLNTGEKPYKSNNGLITTIGYKIGDKISYALEGSVFIAGAAFGFIRDNLEIVKKLNEDAFKKCESNGVIFVPTLTGLGAPYWNSECKGAILGLTRASSKEDIAFGTILGVSYLNYDVLKAMEEDAKTKISQISVDGGASLNKILMQTEANITNCKIMTLSTSEATSLGIFYLIGLNKGLFKSFNSIKKRYKMNSLYEPENIKYTVDYENWKKAIKAIMEY